MKSKVLKLIVVLLIIAAISYGIYYFFFQEDLANDWNTLTPEEKKAEADEFMYGGGSVYFRPGSTEFTGFIEELKALYSSMGWSWDQAAYEEAFYNWNGYYPAPVVSADRVIGGINTAWSKKR